jgi:hypothetical protein
MRRANLGVREQIGKFSKATSDARRRAVVSYALMVTLALAVLPAAAQQPPVDVAYVETISGRAVAWVGETKTDLEVLDLINDKTRLDLAVDAELRICHYRTRRLLTLKGPLQAVISATGITGNGRAIDGAGETCGAPVISVVQGGFALRAPLRFTDVALRPRIKVVSRNVADAARVVLWDRTHQTALATFDTNLAQPELSDGQTYFLTVQVAAAAKWERPLKANKASTTTTLIVVLR